MDASEVTPFVQWWNDWCQSLRSKPWRIAVSNIPYEEGNARFEAGREDPFSIWLFPQGEGREERPFCLINEKLTVESALQLTTASLVIKDTLQVDTAESLYVMVHIFVALEAWAKEDLGKQEGRDIPSVLTFALTDSEYLENPHANSELNPGYSLQKFLWHWNTEGAKHIVPLRAIKERIHSKHTGYVTYATIPPRIVGVPKLPSDQRASAIEEDDPQGDTDGLAVFSFSPNTFLKKGDKWVLEFDDKLAYGNNMDGMRYIARLLSEPGTAIHVSILKGMPRFSSDEVADTTIIEALDTEIADYPSAIASAEGPEREVLVKELERLNNERRKMVGLHGKSRPMNDPMDSARVSVQRACKRAIGHMHKIHPSLGAHLDRQLEYGFTCMYKPSDSPIDWAT